MTRARSATPKGHNMHHLVHEVAAISMSAASLLNGLIAAYGKARGLL